MATRRVPRRTVIALLIGATIIPVGGPADASAGAPAGAGPQPTTAAVELHPAVLQFCLLRGQPAWGPRFNARLARSVFRFVPGGGLVLFQPEGYPTLRGRWNADGGVRASAGLEPTATRITGRTTTVTGRTLLRLHYVAGVSMATETADVPPGHDRTLAYQATVLLS